MTPVDVIRSDEINDGIKERGKRKSRVQQMLWTYCFEVFRYYSEHQIDDR